MEKCALYTAEYGIYEHQTPIVVKYTRCTILYLTSSVMLNPKQFGKANFKVQH